MCWIKVFSKLHMLHYVMFENCTTTVWTHLPLAALERTALLPHFWEKPGWKKTDITELLHHMHMGGHCVCVWTASASVCVGLCSKTCVRLLAVLWGMVLLGSPFRKPNTGRDSGSWELWTSSRWLLTTGGLTSVALCGDNTSGIKLGLLSGGGFQRSTQFQHTQDV